MRQVSIALLAIPLLSSAGCVLTTMRPPAALVDAEVPVVEDTGFFSDGGYEFGVWKTAEVDRDWISTTSSSWQISFFAKHDQEAKQGYRFALQRADKLVYSVECITMAVESGTDIFGFETVKTRTTLTCRLADYLTKEAAGDFGLAIGHPEHKFRANLGGRAFTIRASHEIEGGHAATFDHVGFVVENDQGEPIAAIQTINGDRIWIDQRTPAKEQDVLAATVAALGLSRDIASSLSTSDG